MAPRKDHSVAPNLTWNQLGRGVCAVLGSVHCALGLSVLLGGPSRYPAPTYTPLLQLTNYETWPYGVWWVTAGLLMFVPARKARLLGTLLSSMIACAWMAMFLVAATTYHNAAFTPVAAYYGYALFNGMLFALMVWRHMERDDEDT